MYKPQEEEEEVIQTSFRLSGEFFLYFWHTVVVLNVDHISFPFLHCLLCRWVSIFVVDGSEFFFLKKKILPTMKVYCFCLFLYVGSRQIFFFDDWESLGKERRRFCISRTQNSKFLIERVGIFLVTKLGRWVFMFLYTFKGQKYFISILSLIFWQWLIAVVNDQILVDYK